MKSVADNSMIKVGTAGLLWLVVWSGTHGFFMSSNMWALLPGDANTQPLIATLYILIVIMVALLLFRKSSRGLFIRSKQLYFYILLVLSLVTMPLHYHLEVPIYIYAPMILISSFWQDYLTFGLFQGYVQSKIHPLASIITIGVMFTLGHLIFFLDSLTLEAAYSWLALLAVGIVFAWLRYRFRTIYLINALHISFLFLFV